MKAVVFDKRAPLKLLYREVEKPVPGPGEVLVKIAAAAVNAGDWRSMRLGVIPKRKIFGADVAGVVEAVGTGVRRFRPGDEVAGDLSACGMGGFAEYVAAAEGALATKPARLTFEQAAALPVSAVTALQALRKGEEIKPGHKVLVYGAGGGVGMYLVQLAKRFGAEVTAVCGPGNVELMRTLGADFIVDYTRENVFGGPARYDRVISVNGSRPLFAYRRALRPQGTAVIVGGPLRLIISGMLLSPLLSLGGKKLFVLSSKPDIGDLEFVLKLAADGGVTPVIGRTYPLRETASAMQYVQQGHAYGKTMVQIHS